MDPLAEIAAFKGLWSLAEQGHAVVLVTHRLAATMNADHIYVLADGQVVEEGTHAELMAHEGPYQGMFTAQAAQYGIGAASVGSANECALYAEDAHCPRKSGIPCARVAERNYGPAHDSCSQSGQAPEEA